LTVIISGTYFRATPKCKNITFILKILSAKTRPYNSKTKYLKKTSFLILEITETTPKCIINNQQKEPQQNNEATKIKSVCAMLNYLANGVK